MQERSQCAGCASLQTNYPAEPQRLAKCPMDKRLPGTKSGPSPAHVSLNLGTRIECASTCRCGATSCFVEDLFATELGVSSTGFRWPYGSCFSSLTASVRPGKVLRPKSLFTSD